MHSPRPPAVSPAAFAKLATVAFIWFALSWWGALLAYSRVTLRLVADLRGNADAFPVGPWCVCLAGVVICWYRCVAARCPTDPSWPQTRTAKLSVLYVVLIVIRLAALWTPIGWALPWSGLLWSPEADWALALASLIGLNASTGQATSPRVLAESARLGLLRRPATIPIALFATFSLIYAGYTLYFCQMTMLHGDEGQYLRVTQSIVHDGDIDLANNLEPGFTREFHPVDFDLHPAPSSPSGKVYNLHPVGLSVLLAPAYMLGLKWWANPRLACALLAALLAASCVSLSFLFLKRLQFSLGTALFTSLCIGTTAPLFIHSSQLYPDVPGMLICLAVLTLLSHWLSPGGSYRNLGRGEPVVLACATLLLSCLPYLHPRMTFMAVPPAALVVLQAIKSPRRWTNLIAVFGSAAVGLGSLLAYNLAVSSDWLGHIRPGNAIPEKAVSIAGLVHTIPAHWLNVEQGLVNSSPVYLATWIGLGLLAHRRDRRLVAAMALWATTGLVNGLLSYWDVGFTLSGRLLLTSLPSLLIGLAAAADAIARRLTGLLALIGALLISWETVFLVFPTPELAYQGGQLSLRPVNHSYPWDAHFVQGNNVRIEDIGLWLGVLAAAWCLLVFCNASRPVRLSLLIGAMTLPALWGQSPVAAARLPSVPTTMVAGLENGVPIAGAPVPVVAKLVREAGTETGVRSADGSFVAMPARDSQGILCAYRLPVLTPGIAHVVMASVSSEGESGSSPGHLFAVQRTTLWATAPWSIRYRLPLPEVAANGRRAVSFPVTSPAMGEAGVVFSGAGRLEVGPNSYIALSNPGQAAPYARVCEAPAPIPADGATPSFRAGPLLLPAGRYRASYDVHGGSWQSWLRRNQPPVAMAVCAVDPEEGEQLEPMANHWPHLDHSPLYPTHSPEWIPPLAEKLQAPWWATVPFVNPNAFCIDFVLSRPQTVAFLFSYKGPDLLILRSIRVDRESPPRRAM